MTLRSKLCSLWLLSAAASTVSLSAQSAGEVPLNNGEPVAITLNSGERLLGRAMTRGEGQLVVESSRMGDVTVNWSDVASVSGRDAKIMSEAEMSKIFGRSSTGGAPGAAAAPTEDSQGFPVEPLGEEPEDINSHLLFLRQSSVLLKPGQFDVEFGVSYRRDERRDYIPELQEDGTFTTQDAVRRELETRLSVRVGVADRVEAFASVPLLYASEEEFIEGGASRDNDEFGIGDTVFGLKTLLLREKEGRPEIIFTVAGIAPTGEDPYSNDPNAIALGTGHWGLSGGFTFIKSYDPIILFASIDYTYRFPEDELNARIEPGHEIGYNFGVGFAVNEAVTISGQIQGAYRTEAKVDGDRLEDSSSEPMSIRLGLTYSLAVGRYFDSFVAFGISEDAADSIIGASLTQRF